MLRVVCVSQLKRLKCFLTTTTTTKTHAMINLLYPVCYLSPSRSLSLTLQCRLLHLCSHSLCLIYIAYFSAQHCRLPNHFHCLLLSARSLSVSACYVIILRCLLFSASEGKNRCVANLRSINYAVYFSVLCLSLPHSPSLSARLLR